MTTTSTVSRAGGPALDTAPPGIRPSVWAHMPWPARRTWLQRHGITPTPTPRRRGAARWSDEHILLLAEVIVAELDDAAVAVEEQALVLDPMKNLADIGSVLTDAEKAAGWTPERIRAAERKAAHGSRDDYAIEGRHVYRRCIGRLRKVRTAA